VESVAANVSLVVQRERAEFGSVSVFCFAQSLNNGASNNEDFIFQPQVCIILPAILKLSGIISVNLFINGSPMMHLVL